MRAYAGKTDLALLLGKLLRFNHVVVNVGRAVLAMQIPDIDVIRVQLAKALFKMLLHPRLVWRVCLGRKHNLLPLRPQRRAKFLRAHADRPGRHHPAPRLAVSDQHLNHAAVRRNHAAESDRGHLEPRPAEHFVVELDRGAGSFRSGRLGWLPEPKLRACPCNGHHQSS